MTKPALKPDERDIVERAWKLIEDDEQVTTAFELLADEIERLREERNEMAQQTHSLAFMIDKSERLTAALQICASHSESSNYQGALSYVRKIARSALEPTRTDDERTPK